MSLASVKFSAQKEFDVNKYLRGAINKRYTNMKETNS